MAELDAAVLRAVAVGLVPFGDDEVGLFEWHPCEEQAACTATHGDPCACAGAPWPSVAVRAAVAAAVPVIRAQLAAELSEALLAQRDRLRAQFGGGNPRQAGRQGGLEEAANIVRRHVTAPEVSGG